MLQQEDTDIQEAEDGPEISASVDNIAETDDIVDSTPALSASLDDEDEEAYLQAIVDSLTTAVDEQQDAEHHIDDVDLDGLIAETSQILSTDIPDDTQDDLSAYVDSETDAVVEKLLSLAEDVPVEETADPYPEPQPEPSTSASTEEVDLQAIIDSLSGDSDYLDVPATDSLVENEISFTENNPDNTSNTSEHEDLQAIIDSLAKAMDEQNEGQAYIRHITDSTLPDNDPQHEPQDISVDYDADIDAIIKSLSSEAETAPIALQDGSVMSTDQLVDRIETLWQTLRESWEAVRRQPHLVTKIEELWQLLKNSDQFDNSLPPELAAIMSGSAETSLMDSLQDEEFLAILQGNESSTEQQAFVADETAKHETDHSEAEQTLDAILEQHYDYETAEIKSPSDNLAGETSLTASLQDEDLLAILQDGNTSSTAQQGYIADETADSKTDHSEADAFLEQYYDYETTADKSPSNILIEASDPKVSTENRQSSEEDELDILVSILGDSVDVEQYKALRKQHHQARKDDSSQVESAQGQIKSAVSENTAGTGTIDADEILNQLLQESSQQQTDPAEAQTYEETESVTQPSSYEVTQSTYPYAPTAGKTESREHKPATTRETRVKTPSPATESTITQLTEQPTVDQETTPPSTSAFKPLLVAAGIGAMVFGLWNLLTPEEKQRTVAQSQPTRVAAAKQKRDEFFLPDDNRMRILSSVEVLKRDEDDNTDRSTERQSRSSASTYSDNRIAQTPDPDFVEQRSDTDFVEQRYIPDSDFVEQRYIPDSKYAADTTSASAGVDSGSAVRSGATAADPNISESYTSVYTDTTTITQTEVVDMSGPIKQLKQSTSQGLDNLSDRVSILERAVSGLKSSIESLLGITKSNRSSTSNLLDTSKNNSNSIDKLLGATNGNRDSIDKLASATKGNRDAIDKLVYISESNRDASNKLLNAMENNRASMDNKISDLGARISALNESYKEAIYAMAQIQKGQDGVTIVLRDPENMAQLQDSNGQLVKHITHVVAKGDTLWAIAKRYINNPYRYPELARLSKIKNPDRIYPGDKVHIIIRTE